MKYYITYETFETYFLNNWAENKTGVVNYITHEDDIHFHIKWVWDYIMIVSKDKIIEIMQYNDMSKQYNGFDDYLEAFNTKHFGASICCMTEQQALFNRNPKPAEQEQPPEVEVQVEVNTDEVANDDTQM
jgi:hypothetical protein